MEKEFFYWKQSSGYDLQDILEAVTDQIANDQNEDYATFDTALHSFIQDEIIFKYTASNGAGEFLSTHYYITFAKLKVMIQEYFID